jgi:hypothetical protein
VNERRPANDSAIPVPEDLAGRPLTFKDRLDINNDGRLEYVYILEPAPEQEPNGLIEDTFTIPVTPRLFIYDRDLTEIKPRLAPEPAYSLGAADGSRVILYRGTYYVVMQEGERLRYVLKIDHANVAHPTCAFEERLGATATTYRALTPVEWLNRSFPDSLDLWNYAFSSERFAIAELLLANGHNLTETVGGKPLLLWAADDPERADIVDWLLDHYANPKLMSGPAGTALLQEAMSGMDLPLIQKLIQHGADPSKYLDHDISQLLTVAGEDAQSVIVAVVERVGYVPEQLLLDAMDHPALLDRFVEMGAKVRPSGVSWHAGKQMPVPLRIARAIHESDDPHVVESVDRLLKRGTVPPEGVFAEISYGSFDDGVLITRYEGSTVSDDELLRFATALCDTFTQYDCGTGAMLRRARAWASTLTESCPDHLRSKLDESACHLFGYIMNIGNASVTAFPMRAGHPEELTTAVDERWLMDGYRARHGE